MGISPAARAAAKWLSESLSDVPPEERRVLVNALLAAQRARLAQAFDQAVDDVPAPSKAEWEKLSDTTRNDVRMQVLEQLAAPDRDMWTGMFSILSSEKTSSKLTFATWGLVTATVGLVIITIVLVAVTAAGSSATTPVAPGPSPARAPVCAIVPDACR